MRESQLLLGVVDRARRRTPYVLSSLPPSRLSSVSSPDLNPSPRLTLDLPPRTVVLQLTQGSSLSFLKLPSTTEDSKTVRSSFPSSSPPPRRVAARPVLTRFTLSALVYSVAAGLIEKYGFIPKSLYPESYSSSNSSRLNTLLT